jgi:hypothetical protein
VLALVLAISGCATQRTLDELGQPTLGRALPDKVTIVSHPEDPQIAGFRGEEPGPRWDFRVRPKVQTWREGDDVIVDVQIFAAGNDAIERAAIAAHPLAADKVARYVQGGHLDDAAHPLVAACSTKRLDDGCHELAVKFPRSAVQGATRIALPTLVVFEHGWVLVTFPHVPVPD